MGQEESRFRGPAPRPFHRLVAAAIEGDREALAGVLESDGLVEWARRHRMGPGIYLAAAGHGIEGPVVEACRMTCLETAAQWMRLREVLSQAGEVLGVAGVPWMPLKGLDTAERFFPRPELRLSSDIDLLVPRERLDDALVAFEGAGWSFESSCLSEAYQRAEGYNWPVRSPHGAYVELHYRLWGMVPDSVVEACWRTAVAAPELGRCGFLLEPSMAFIVSAVHSWIHAGRPQFIYWWEMKLIADRLTSTSAAVSTAREHGLQFPVGLAAEYVGRLWNHQLCLELAATLLGEIRQPERLALGWVRRRGIEALKLELLYIARLLARRPSRMGWKAIYRRAWPHPGTVESSTPESLPWWRRRAVATMRNLRIAGR